MFLSLRNPTSAGRGERELVTTAREMQGEDGSVAGEGLWSHISKGVRLHVVAAEP